MTEQTSEEERRARQGLPSITAIVATKDRPQLLRRTLRSILAQDYRGRLDVVVVFDQDEIDDLDDVEVPVGISLRTVRNSRTPGLAGGRNSGIQIATSDLVAFCDDDDTWLPSKLSQQVALWRRHPEAAAVSTGIRIITAGHAHERIPAPMTARKDFLASRVAEVHTSSLLVRHRDVEHEDGFVDELLPASYGEDYDILLELSRSGPIASVQSSLVDVHWDRPSFFAEKWRGLAAGLTYLLAKHPDLAVCRDNAARMRGQIAFAHAAAGDRAGARHWARDAMSARRREPRAWAALAVSTGAVSPGVMVRTMNKLGKGL